MGIKQSKTKRLPWVCPICGYVNYPTKNNKKIIRYIIKPK